MFEKTINGKKVGFCFDFYSFGISEEIMNTSLDDMLQSLSNSKKPKIKLISALFYGAAVNYNELNGIRVDFKINNMGEWLNEIGFEEAMKMLTKAVTILKPKNIEPPQTEGVVEKVGELVNT